jgi:DNA segregation ATPase FtsK/SpoIIIE, S-DNA-T family
MTVTEPNRFRLDAVALVAWLGLGSIAAALVAYPPLLGSSNFIGPAAEDVARPLVNALGFGVLVLVGGLMLVVGLYVARAAWWKLGLRTLGWVTLAGFTALLADQVQTPGPAVSVFGRGGAVGAFLAESLHQQVQPPLPLVLLIAVGFLGIVMVADGVVKAIFATLTAMLFRGNHFVGRLGDRLLSGLVGKYSRWKSGRAARKALAEVTQITQPVPLVRTLVAPIIRHTELVASDPDAETPIEITKPIPITHSQPAPQLRVHLPPEEPHADHAGYEMPALDLLSDSEVHPVQDHEQQLRERALLLEQTFTDFGLTVKVVGIHTGPVITQYEIALDTGLRLSKVTNLSDDLALCLRVSAVRIVAPLPGRNTVGIEVPNEHRQTVRLKDLIQSTTAKAAKFKLPIFLGKDVEGRPLVYDMAAMPHLLIAGRTGTGKSVCLNSIILSFLYTRTPEECRMIMIDPKKVELSEYGKIPHLMHPVVTDDKKAEAILAWAVDKMEERYELLRKARVRNIASYNELGREEVLRRADPQNEDERAALPNAIPYIVIIVDEVGDLIMSMKKEVESHIIRLAQKSRAAGIHLILATQKPTVDVVTGLIKSNLPARICFQVASRADSAVVLDEKGADKLLGAGDMLFLQPGTSTIIRAQGAYVDDREIERTVTAMEIYEPNFESELLNLKAKEDVGGPGLGEKLRERDPLYEQAVEIVIREQRGSTSLLQRALGIGYGKASRFIDFMAEDGIVGGYNGSNARDVLVSGEEWSLRQQA